jgi:hypothetical protein
MDAPSSWAGLKTGPYDSKYGCGPGPSGRRDLISERGNDKFVPSESQTHFRAREAVKIQ